MPADRNFDALSGKFKQRIYGNNKGNIRLAVLERDLAEYIDWFSAQDATQARQILDVGAGQGQFALKLAGQNRMLVLADISRNMLSEAQQNHQAAGSSHVYCVQAALQQLPFATQQTFDLVLCHAVLEWLRDPLDGLRQLAPWIGAQGFLSLMIYNEHGVVLRNMLRGNLRYIARGDFSGQDASLTPQNPLTPQAVEQCLQELGLRILCKSGVRTFYDYMEKRGEAQCSLDDILAVEFRYNRVEPFASIGRYVHYVCGR
jgi:S-adenosylmethionine-dependent methyltransferase